MNFLLDEGVPYLIKKYLEKKGHQVFTLQDLNKRQLQNGAVANLAIDKDAVLITVDSDFLDLKKSIQKRARIIYVKVHPSIPENILELIENNLEPCKKDLKEPGTILLTPDDYILDRIS